VANTSRNHSGNVWNYSNGYPNYNGGQKYPVQGFFDENRNLVLPFGPVDLKAHPNAFPDGAIWPKELQSSACFTQEGQIQNWDAYPEYLDGDFYDLKDYHLGADDPNAFTPTTAVTVLTEAYKYWIAYADIDGFRLDTVKHMGRGPTRYFVESIHEFGERIGKDRFMVVGEITGGNVYDIRETTGLDAVLGIGNMMQLIWNMPRGEANPNVQLPPRALMDKTN
jgi:Alpha amylase, catalytic domain